MKSSDKSRWKLFGANRSEGEKQAPVRYSVNDHLGHKELLKVIWHHLVLSPVSFPSQATASAWKVCRSASPLHDRSHL